LVDSENENNRRSPDCKKVSKRQRTIIPDKSTLNKKDSPDLTQLDPTVVAINIEDVNANEIPTPKPIELDLAKSKSSSKNIFNVVRRQGKRSDTGSTKSLPSVLNRPEPPSHVIRRNTLPKIQESRSIEHSSSEDIKVLSSCPRRKLSAEQKRDLFKCTVEDEISKTRSSSQDRNSQNSEHESAPLVIVDDEYCQQKSSRVPSLQENVDLQETAIPALQTITEVNHETLVSTTAIRRNKPSLQRRARMTSFRYLHEWEKALNKQEGGMSCEQHQENSSSLQKMGQNMGNAEVKQELTNIPSETEENIGRRKCSIVTAKTSSVDSPSITVAAETSNVSKVDSPAITRRNTAPTLGLSVSDKKRLDKVAKLGFKERLSVTQSDDARSRSPSPSPRIGRRRYIGASSAPSTSIKDSSSVFRKFTKQRSKDKNDENERENVIHYAVSQQKLSLLTQLLQDDPLVNVNYMRPPGVNVLHQACVFGNLDMIKLLVEHGASINKRTWSNLSPLQIAVSFGHFDVAEYLLRKGADCGDVRDGFEVQKKQSK